MSASRSALAIALTSAPAWFGRKGSYRPQKDGGRSGPLLCPVGRAAGDGQTPRGCAQDGSWKRVILTADHRPDICQNLPLIGIAGTLGWGRRVWLTAAKFCHRSRPLCPKVPYASAAHAVRSQIRRSIRSLFKVDRGEGCDRSKGELQASGRRGRRRSPFEGLGAETPPPP